MDEHDFTFHHHDHDHHHQDGDHHHHHHSSGVNDDVDVDTTNHDDAAEAMLASLRAVINDDNDANTSDNDLLSHTHTHQQHGESSQSQNNIHSANPPTLNAFVPVPGTITIPLSSTSSLSTPLSSSSQSPDKLLASLNAIIKDNQTILDAMNSPGAINNLAQSIKGLGEGNSKLAEIAKGLTAQFRLAELSAGLQGLESSLDPTLASPVIVLRSEYDALKAKYDALLAAAPATGGKRAGASARKPKVPKVDGTLSATEDRRRDDSAVPLGGIEGRKKRSIKLEHLVHKMANRRLGVEYQISGFECKGTRDLPDPSSEPPKADTSVNGVDEYRPQFVGDVDADTVKPFVDRVVEDVVEAWNEAEMGVDEPDVDRERIVGAVNIYWTRLVKRFDEQLHRERGEVHRDELSRRKQNTYRRQQSLLARRLAAFDSSPLNVCKLRALYRTLLTIDFAAQTQDQPDPKREYTPDEWYAYRKAACGSRANEAHEVIDQFWLSANVRALLNILDVYSADQNARTRRKGRPKQPNPTFHLPSKYWDRSTLPILRPKDTSGLPISGAQGLILFRFHVDEQVQLENPEWALELYDNPPIPEEDATLPSLPEIMATPTYVELKSAIKAARDSSNPKVLRDDEVLEINARVHRPDEAIEVDQAILDDPVADSGLELTQAGAEDGEFMTFAALTRLATSASSNASAINGADHSGAIQEDEIDPALAGLGPASGIITKGESPGSTSTPGGSTVTTSMLTNPFILSAIPAALSAEASASTSASTSGAGAGAGGTASPIGPSPGSSMRARKLGKRMASEVPGGAATPVPKRRKELSSGIGVALTGQVQSVSAEELEVEGDLHDDAAFLEAL